MIHLIELQQYPILEQLRLEEALLKADKRQWCIINYGTSDAIVMGISGTQEKFIDSRKLSYSPVPVIRRFSGGGTVFVDGGTLFVTFICQSGDVGIPPQQQKILDWTKQLYEPVFGDDFRLHENDYALLDLKFGGNAQYLRKDRWLHHTSFLWDYDRNKMDYLLVPEKKPKYRQNRGHAEFLCTLKDRFSDVDSVVRKIKTEVKRKFKIESVDLAEVEKILLQPHHKSTALV